MAIKIKKKVEPQQEEAVQVDQILGFGERAFKWVEQRFKAVAIAFVAGLLLIGLLAQLISAAGEGSVDEGASVLAAALVLDGPVVSEVEAPEAGQWYLTRADRAAAVMAALEEPLSASDPAPAARLLAGTAALDRGDPGAALAHFEAARGAEGLRALQIAAALGESHARAASGNLDGAQDTLTGLTAAPMSIQLALELEVARLREAAGDLEGAKALYDSVAERSLDPENIAEGGSELADAARNRAAIVGVLLGAPEGSATTPADDEGSGAPL